MLNFSAIHIAKYFTIPLLKYIVDERHVDIQPYINDMLRTVCEEREDNEDKIIFFLNHGASTDILMDYYDTLGQDFLRSVLTPLIISPSAFYLGECRICYDKKNNIVPFPCHHDYCNNCVKEMTKDDFVRCPFCRKFYLVSIIL